MEGRTKDGQFVYIRYRWGELEAGIGRNENEAVRNTETVYKDETNLADGEMSKRDMRHNLQNVFDFSEILCP